MIREPLAFVGTCDLSGNVRGKGFPLADAERRVRCGMGYTASNIMMSAFGPIYASPFGTEGDLMLVPDPSTKVDLQLDESTSERFYLGDIRTLDGRDWECCPRSFLRRSLTALRDTAGLTVRAAFEQEFNYTGTDEYPNTPYALAAWRQQGSFGELFMGALRAAGVRPDSFLPEYGARQFEVTIRPTNGLRAADEAVILRELARAVALRLGHRAIFAPMLAPDGIGNGTHVHFSLLDGLDKPALYDPDAPHELSEIGQHFAAGLLAHLPALAAVTAPSVASYYRLTPNRWAPTWCFLGVRDRGAALRVCPIFAAEDAEAAAAQFNLEYRVADATASPYMALGVIVMAGLDGIRRKLTVPEMPAGGFWHLTDEQRLATNIRRLPASLGEALDALVADNAMRDWLGPVLHDAYVQFKRSEITALGDASSTEICKRYGDVY